MLYDFVNFKTAQKLNNVIKGKDNRGYAINDITVTDGLINGHGQWYPKETLINLNDIEPAQMWAFNVKEKVYFAPTIAEVLDYFARTFNVYVEFTPWHTYALQGHVAYTFKVFSVNEETAKMDLIHESEDGWLASMWLCVEEIVQKFLDGEMNRGQ